MYGEFWWLKEIQVLSLGLGQSNITNLKKGHLLANLNLYPKPLANPNTADPNPGVELVVTIALSKIKVTKKPEPIQQQQPQTSYYHYCPD